MDSRTYFKVDDHLPENPKIVAAGENAELLYLHGLAYCSRQMTDGLIPKAVVSRLVSRGAEKRAKSLVENGLWADKGEFFEVHDYLMHQRSRSEIEAQRQAKREAGAKGGAASAAQRKAKQGSNETPTKSNPESESNTESESDNPPGDAAAVLRDVLVPGTKYPDRFKGHLGKEVKGLLTEGFSQEQVTAAAKRCVVKGLSPGTLPSLVVQVSGNGAIATGPARSEYPEL